MTRLFALLSVLGIALAGVILPAQAHPARALDVWSWDDPVFLIDGHIVAVNLGIRQSDLAAISGVTVILTVPAGTDARLIALETRNYTPSVQIVTSSAFGRRGVGLTTFNVDVQVDSARSFDYQINVSTPESPDTLASNTFARSNARLTLSFRLPSSPQPPATVSSQSLSPAATPTQSPSQPATQPKR